MGRRLIALMLAAAALSILAGGAAWSFRIPILAWAATRLLERQGLGPAEFAIDAVDLHRLHLHQVSLRGGAVRANEVSASFSPLGLARAHLRSVAVSGLDVALIIGKDGMALGGKPLDAAAGAGGGSPLGGWRIDALTLADARVSLRGTPWAAQAIAGSLRVQPEGLTAHITIGRIGKRQQPLLAAPLAVSATAGFAGPRLDFRLHATVGTGAAASLEATGAYDRSSHSAAASMNMAPIVFHRGALQPSSLSPAFGGMIEDVDGSVAAAGSLRWAGGQLSSDLTLRLASLGFATSVARIRDLNGAIRLIRLWPPATAPHQMLAATIEAAGLPPAGLRIEGRLTAKPSLELERAAVAIAGGEITASPFAIDPAAPRVDTTLQLDHVELGEIMKLLNIDGLSGGGQLDGRIPLHLEDGKIAISGGSLAARGPGVLQYRPQRLPKEIAAAGEPVELALQALANFHYDRLALDLDKQAGGEGTVRIHLAGSNPAVQSGQPFQFNIRIDSNFDRLAEYARLSLSSAQDLLRRAARGTQQ